MRLDRHAGSDVALTDTVGRLDALVDWERRARAAMRVDVASVADLLSRLGDPQRCLRIVHVAGTKGKGSVCALIEAGLLQAGLRAGRYGSPHVERLHERVSLMGRPIGDAAFARALSAALDARDAARRDGTPGVAATWFDAMTAAAFAAFADAGLDWAVVEVGLGGRLDSTNVVTPELAIVTNIGLEHCDALGSTREAIAAEKAGIVKHGKPVLTALAADDPAGGVLAAKARGVGAPLYRVEVAGIVGVSGRNLLLARHALTLLGTRGVRSARRDAALGVEDLPDRVADMVRLPGRLEVFELVEHGRCVRVVVDGAHVDFALREVLDELRLDPRHAAQPVVLLALSADKDARAMVRELADVASRVFCTRLDGPRGGWLPEQLQQCCAAVGLAADVIDEPHAALSSALDLASRSSWLLVTGSLRLAGCVLAIVRTRAVVST